MIIKTFKKNGKHMKRILLSLITLSAVGIVGCAEPEPSILINAHVFRTGAELGDFDEMTGTCEPPSFDSCAAASFDDENTIATRLFADVSKTAPQVATTMKNQLINTETLAQLGEDNNLRRDTNAIQLESLSVTFSPSGPLKNIGDGGRIEVPIGTLLRSESQLHLSTKLALFKDAEALKAAVKSIAGEDGGFVVTSVDLQYFGKTLAGNEVVSNIITMPIELCHGCAAEPTACAPFSAATAICIP